MIDLSVIIVSFNTKEITKKCLDTLLSDLTDASLTFEILVVDNASTDGSVTMLKEMSKKYHAIQCIYSEKNLGFAKANNVAYAKSKGTHLLFLNSDTETLKDAASSLYAFFASKKNTFDFVGPKLLESDGVTPQASCGPAYTLLMIFAALFLRGDYWGLTRSSPRKTRKVDWVSGACFMCARSAFDAVGGFDENIFMYMEEIDLFYRAKKQGLNVGFYPHARWIHLGSASSQGRTQPIVQVFRGLMYFYRKHHSHLSQRILFRMLQCKAYVARLAGLVSANKYLTDTYGQALAVLEEHRR